ncbi:MULTISPECIES: FtsK/SpoIIIE domain-containing protein [unclassified Pseudoalteromonas]|uniref:FtsK/SpoIIIE domain-containing protein n=1 Tax=unclassified Pseudoalteromonas TaxID=194690 RepID=UPI0025B54C48|nr:MULTISPECIES: FtsK/SpoIIIE domain-containing protein [unclassified Pseudoalteromonas]MDN3380697.1 FtsK/SpoIIIE domain-containing protein [Pseudoalteromonas sp. APC 3893]MDN3389084.1 FtsK/SpoIIIE domain-containing protein [Pseudoalteromonas sp. APC 4017]
MYNDDVELISSNDARKTTREQVKESALATIKPIQNTVATLKGKVFPNAINNMDAEYEASKKNAAKAAADLRNICARLPEPLRAQLDSVNWEEYDFAHNYLPKNLVVGLEEITYSFGESGKQVIQVPKEIPFYSSDNCYSFAQGDDSITIINTLVFRLAAMLPYSSQFTLIDPIKMGQSFPYTKRLPFKRMVDNDVSRVLEEILTDIVRIQNSFLDNNTERLIDVDEEILGNAKFELIVAKDFPQAYDRRSIELLAKIASTGPKAGKMVVLDLDSDKALPNGAELSVLFPDLKHIYKNENQLPWNLGKGYRDSVRSTDTINAILDGLSRAKPKETKLGFSDVIEMNPELWWQEDSMEVISAPIGGSGSRKNDIELWFGERNKQPSSHGMLAAMTGAGKSNLYHAFILSLASRYSPEDLQFYLIDGKQGVEFQSYPKLPHARVVSLSTSPQLARSVLQELLDEMNRRNDMFKNLGLSDFISYRKAGSPNGKLPRLMLIIDEYQTIFEDDKTGLGSQLMISIASQSRSAGIHMFVGSQKFSVPGMSQPQATFSNINLRVAMKMSGEEVTSLQEFGSKGKQLIRGCTETGQVVVSHNGGANELPCDTGRVAYIDEQQRQQMLEQLSNKWQGTNNTILLDGSEQPEIKDNTQLQTLFTAPQRLSEDEWISYANKPDHFGGLNDNEWYPIERPSVLWLGKEMNIHGQAKVILRRRAHEHMLLVGDSNEARLGMLSYMVAQLPINAQSSQYQVHILDRSIKGSQWCGVLSAANDSVLNNHASFSESFKDFSTHLTSVMAEFEKRQHMDEEEMLLEPSIFLIVNEAQRVKELVKKDNSFGMKAYNDDGGVNLATLLEQGSEYGIHLVLSFDNVRSVTKAFDRNDIESFRHKVALQMSEEDSFRFLKTRDAAKLQADGKKPIYALHIDQMQNRPTKFKPYCYSQDVILHENFEHLSNLYAKWA